MLISRVKIRKVGKMDIAEMVRQRISYLIELYGMNDDHDPKKCETEMRAYFEDSIAEGRIIALVATHKDTAVGYGALLIKQIPGDFVHSTYYEADILNMYTIPAARKKGVASLILSSLIDEARKIGISKLSLHTTKEGEKIYRSAGFTEPSFPYLEMVIYDNIDIVKSTTIIGDLMKSWGKK